MRVRVNREELPDKYCLQCGGKLRKDVANESKARYMAKKFDSTACSRIYLKKEQRGWWNPALKQYRTTSYD